MRLPNACDASCATTSQTAMIREIIRVFLPSLAVLLFFLDALSLDGATKTSTALVILLAVLVTDLSTGLSSAVLSALFKTRVQIGTDDALVELGASNVLHTVESILVSVVFDEAEATWGLVESVEPHDQSLDLSSLCEQFVDLLFRCVEGPCVC